MIISLLLGSVAVAFVIAKLPSTNPDPGKTKRNTDASVLAIGVLPLIGMAFAATTLWAWHLRTPDAFGGDFNLIDRFINFVGGGASVSAVLQPRLSNFILFAVVLYIAGYVLHLAVNTIINRSKPVISVRTILAALVSSVTGAVLLWWAATRMLVPENFAATSRYNLRLYLCFAVPVFLLIFLIASTIFVGLASRIITDEDREWLARYGAWILITSGVWMAANALVLIAPSGFEQLIFLSSDVTGWPKLEASIVSAIGIISGVLSLGGGFSGKSLVKNEPRQSKTSKILAIAPKPAAVVFLIFIIVGLAYLTTIVLYYAGKAIASSATGSSLGDMNAHLHKDVLYGSSILYLFIALATLLIIGLIMACFVNVNKFSLHGAYRDRLIRAYLGASNFFRQRNSFTGFDDSDNLQLHRLCGQRPFHVINATLNLVSGKNLAWQNRKAASFTMSPLHCGSWLLGYRNSNEYCRNAKLGNCESLDVCNKIGKRCANLDDCKLPGKALRLGTAMAISGAAANPNMGYYSSSVVTFLMSLFNIRLGWWLGNTGCAGSDYDWFGSGKLRFFEKASPSVAVFPLLNETLGRTDEDKRFVMVTDGGHFENLGLYEMILRRCKFIILSDGAADQDFKFGEISNAIQKCKVDLGVDIKFPDGGISIFARNSPEIVGIHNARFSIADITYPEKDDNGDNLTGCLLYTRPAYYKTEPTDIKHYADENQTFPHQSTADQMYDEKQFEAYRGLGFLTMQEIIGTSKPGSLLDLMGLIRSQSGPLT